MAMAQFAATNGATADGSSSAPAVASSSATSSSNSSAPHRPSKQEVQAVLGQFDAKINQMMDYPAKDIINALTKLAERIDFAPEIVSFLETKIHRVNNHTKQNKNGAFLFLCCMLACAVLCVCMCVVCIGCVHFTFYWYNNMRNLVLFLVAFALSLSLARSLVDVFAACCRRCMAGQTLRHWCDERS